MKIFVERLYYKDGYIIGRLYINGVFICNTLELPPNPSLHFETSQKCPEKALKGRNNIELGVNPINATSTPTTSPRRIAAGEGERGETTSTDSAHALSSDMSPLQGSLGVGDCQSNGVYTPFSDMSPLQGSGGAGEGRYGKGCCIAPGTYRVKLYVSPKFKAQLPLLEKVPGRSGILIHAGNTAKDTQGCILVGQNTKVGRLTKSREAVKKIVSAMRDAEKLNEPVVITIR